MRRRFLKDNRPILYRRPWASRLEYHIWKIIAVALVLSFIGKVLAHGFRIAI